jgi:hypothetical protein
MLAKISQYSKGSIQAIVVKLLLGDPFGYHRGSIPWYGDPEGYVFTLRIFPDTSFQEVKSAACRFWGKSEQLYILTDSHFTNLSTYSGETVASFFTQN